MEVDNDAIKEICQNVDDLDIELQVYYKEQIKLYEESIKINPEIRTVLDSAFHEVSLIMDFRSLKYNLSRKRIGSAKITLRVISCASCTWHDFN
jgi:hypothetical protein